MLFLYIRFMNIDSRNDPHQSHLHRLTKSLQIVVGWMSGREKKRKVTCTMNLLRSRCVFILNSHLFFQEQADSEIYSNSKIEQSQREILLENVNLTKKI